jgi:hypothetical protein
MGAGASGASGAGGGVGGGAAAAAGWGTAIGAVAGGTMGLIEASKQAAAGREAERVAEAAAAKAEQLQETNFLGAVQVPVQAYQQGLNRATANQMQSIAALQEAGSRELAGGIGRVDIVGNEQINEVTNQLADRLYNLDIAQANEAGQTNDAMAKISLERAMGAQKAAMAAQLARTQALGSAVQGFGSALVAGENMLTPVYKEGADTVASQMPKMPGVMIPNAQAPQIENTQLQGLASPEVQNIIQMLMKNPQILNMLR